MSVSLPWGIGSIELEPDRSERNAAWSLYVELVTRVAAQSLEADQGLLRESLTSLNNLFAITREILKVAGPGVGASHDSVGRIAIDVLNQGLRPFLAKWHPLLQEWEAQRDTDVSARAHEQNWSEESTLRRDLRSLVKELEEYVSALGAIAGVHR